MAKKKEVKGIGVSSLSIYEKALKEWGFEAQKGMLHEEMGELMQVLNKHDRGKADVKAVVDEIADVMIMCEQVAFYFGREAVHHRKIQKLLRLQKLFGRTLVL